MIPSCPMPDTLEEARAAAERVNDEIARWEGCRVVLWSYLRAFRTLTLRLSHNEPLGDLHLVCRSTAVVKAPVELPEANLTVDVLDDLQLGGHPAFLVRDEQGLLEIVAAAVHTQPAEAAEEPGA